MPDALPVLIVDDEPLGRDLVRHLLKSHPDFQVAAECRNGEEALAAVERLAPRVVFLDVEMPRLDGMTLLQRLTPARRPLIVLITAHDTYAIQAFAAHVFDYLLKPFDQERFDQTLARVRQRLEQVEAARLGRDVRHLLAGASDDPPRPPASPASPQRIVVRESSRITFVEVADIEWLEASGNYVALHVAQGKTHLVHETMTGLAGRLDPRRFLRIHRSTTVRIDRIRELLPHFNGEYVVVLKDGTRLKLSRSYVDAAREQLGLV